MAGDHTLVPPTSTTVCSYCSTLADPEFLVSKYEIVNHHPSIEKLVASSKSCPLCRVFVSWIGEENVNTATVISEGGHKTRPYAYAVGGGAQTTEVFKAYSTFTVDSPISSHETPRFVLGAIKRSATKRAIRTSIPVELSARAETFSRWVHNCEKHHTGCLDPERPDGMPARLIDVGYHGTTDQLRLVDVDNEGLNSSNQYIALSYCWGPAGVPTKTTTNNLASFMQYVPEKNLSRTFQDAFRITRQMSCRYIWIDALCIIQDDPSDWERESAKMAAVFNNAYLTISASAAEDCEGGCETTLPTVDTRYFKLPDNSNKEAPTHIFVKGDCCSEEPFMKTLIQFPINSRGWILQEALLSRRILHFTKTQCVWQCHSLLESEDQFIHNSSTLKVSKIVGYAGKAHLCTAPLANLTDLRDRDLEKMTWWHWVLDHAKRKLTFPSDDLPSLAGIVSFYGRLTQNEPVVGLWKNDLQIHLSWTPGSPFSPSHRTPSQPTWSWTSISRQVRENVVSYRQFSRLYEFKDFWRAPLGDISICWKGQPFTSPLLSATLTLGRVQWPQPRLSIIVNRTIEQRFKKDNSVFRSARHLVFNDEKIQEAESDKNVLLLWIGGHLNVGPDPNIYTFRAFSLMIQAIGGFENRFRRVGVVVNEWDCLPQEAQITRQKVLEHLVPVDFVHLV